DRAGGGVRTGKAEAERHALHGAAALRIAGEGLPRRRPHIVEVQLPGLPAEIADLGDGAAGAALGQFALRLLDRDRGRTGAAGGGARIVDAAEDADVVGAVGEGAPVFRAVQHPLVALAPGAALHAGEVRAGARLGERGGAQVLALGHQRDLAVPLLAI